MAKIVEAGNRCFVAFIDVAKALYSVWEDSLCCQHFEPSVRGKTWHVLYLVLSIFSLFCYGTEPFVRVGSIKGDSCL